MAKFIFKKSLNEFYSFRTGEPVGIMQTVTGVNCDSIKAVELYDARKDKSIYVVTANKNSSVYVFSITEDELSSNNFIIRSRDNVSIFVSTKLSAFVKSGNSDEVFTFTDFGDMSKQFSKWLYDCDMEAYNMITASQQFLSSVKCEVEVPSSRYLNYLDWNTTNHNPDAILINGHLSCKVESDSPFITLIKKYPGNSTITDLSSGKVYCGEGLNQFNSDEHQECFINLTLKRAHISERLLDDVCDYLYSHVSVEKDFSFVLRFASKEVKK